MMLPSTRGSILRQAKLCFQPPRSLFSPLARLVRCLSSLAVLEQREGKLQSASLNAVTAAQKIGGSITGLIAGSGVKSVAEAAAKVKGLDKILVIENAAYDKVGISTTCHIKLLQNLTVRSRVYQRTTPLYLWKTSRKKALHMSSLDTRPLGRI